MKKFNKFFYVLLCLSMLAGISGCGTASGESSGRDSQINETSQSMSVSQSEELAQSPGEMITFYLVNHGESLLEELDRIQGWGDSHLTKQGEITAYSLGYGMRDFMFNFVNSLHEADETGKAENFEMLRTRVFGTFDTIIV